MTKTSPRGRSRSVGLLLSFVALSLFAVAAPGFAYFYWVREAGLGMSIVIGFLLGSFFFMTIDIAGDAVGSVGKTIRKLRRR